LGANGGRRGWRSLVSRGALGSVTDVPANVRAERRESVRCLHSYRAFRSAGSFNGRTDLGCHRVRMIAATFMLQKTSHVVVAMSLLKPPNLRL
jgi:hypothetical protein